MGYFERSGEFEGDTLTFRVRREQVGDFLATLAVIDSQGHARYVSFPSLEPEEDDDGLVEVAPDRLRITPTGRYFLRTLCSEHDAYFAWDRARWHFSRSN